MSTPSIHPGTERSHLGSIRPRALRARKAPGGSAPGTEQGVASPQLHERQERRAETALSRAAYERFLPLVRRTAMRLSRKLPMSISTSDLVGYGWVGLLEAYRRVDAFTDSDEFEAYALYRVRGAMLDHLRCLDPATRAARQASRAIARASAKMERTLGRSPEEEEIARELGVDLERYRTMLSEVARAGMSRLELLDVDRMDEGALGASESESDAIALRELLANKIGGLPQRLQQVLALYYQEDLSLRDIGAVLGVTESRACQLHAEALHRLRGLIGRE